jgi:hypothetical protein
MNHIAVAAPSRQRTGMAILMGQDHRSLVSDASPLDWLAAGNRLRAMTRPPWRTRQVILCAVWALLAQPALAELGGTSESIPSDQIHLHAALRSVALPTHVRHELALPNGGAVHEYTNAQGQVFAVRWQGPGKPDLRKLLGTHFGALQAVSASPAGRFGRMSRQTLTVDRADLKIESGGHMGYFWGLAWLPALLPSGVQPGDLQ